MAEGKERRRRRVRQEATRGPNECGATKQPAKILQTERRASGPLVMEGMSTAILQGGRKNTPDSSRRRSCKPNTKPSRQKRVAAIHT